MWKWIHLGNLGVTQYVFYENISNYSPFEGDGESVVVFIGSTVGGSGSGMGFVGQ